MVIQRLEMILFCLIIVGFYHQIAAQSSSQLACTRVVQNRTLRISCVSNITIEDIYIDDIEALNTIEKLQVTSNSGRGPLSTIPPSVCRLTQLNYLDLSYNQIANPFVRFSSPCLSQLETLDLSDNVLSEVPARWISQMPKLRVINLGKNQLTEIPNKMFYNISNLEILDVFTNRLTTFELWLILIKIQINYRINPVARLTNNCNVDLSNYQSTITASILLSPNQPKIDFDDSLFEMFNRCGEITSTYTPMIKQAIKIIDTDNPNILNWKCSCDQYYLQEYVVPFQPGGGGGCVTCPSTNCLEMCFNQSFFNPVNLKPRFCKIKDSETGDIPVYIDSELCDSNFLSHVNDLEELSQKLYTKLYKINSSDLISTYKLAELVDESDKKIQSDISLLLTELTQHNFQEIITYIEDFIASITIPLNITIDSVAILSVRKEDSIYSFSQIIRNGTFFEYFTEITGDDEYTTTITIAPSFIEYLLPTDVYTFYYLPSSIFRFASEDQTIIIVSPIVGIYFPTNSPRIINMSFTDIKRSSGRYSCVFWQSNRWNNTGCSHSFDSKSNRHFCTCTHTTSFALIFIPGKTIQQTYIPSITIALLSIVCFGISIILSIYRQAESFRHLSMTNIFTLCNSIIFFLLLTIILIQGYQSNEKIDNHCSQSQENLVITTYFFLVSTFASKTLLGICYFLTIFFHLIFIQLTVMSNKWFYIGFFLVILVALIPTMMISIIVRQWRNLFLQYQGICWLNSSVIFRFISIPIIVCLSLNGLIIAGITIRLLQFSLGQKTVKKNEKRMIISMMIWLALCVSLGFAWIFGPFLDVLISDTDETSSVIKLWVFAMFIGLEGVWVLIVNVIFYINQRVNKKSRPIFSNKNRF